MLSLFIRGTSYDLFLLNLNVGLMECLKGKIVGVEKREKISRGNFQRAHLTTNCLLYTNKAEI